jgi:hypothetical protein
MYGHELPLIARYVIGRPKLQDPRVVRKFIVSYQEWIEQHGLAKQAFLLQTRAMYPFSQELAEEYEWIDRMKIEGLSYAD